jgi:hypothetical protein
MLGLHFVSYVDVAFAIFYLCYSSHNKQVLRAINVFPIVLLIYKFFVAPFVVSCDLS